MRTSLIIFGSIITLIMLISLVFSVNPLLLGENLRKNPSTNDRREVFSDGVILDISDDIAYSSATELVNTNNLLDETITLPKHHDVAITVTITVEDEDSVELVRALGDLDGFVTAVFFIEPNRFNLTIYQAEDLTRKDVEEILAQYNLQIDAYRRNDVFGFFISDSQIDSNIRILNSTPGISAFRGDPRQYR